jgi:hypothetical protein
MGLGVRREAAYVGEKIARFALFEPLGTDAARS